MIGLTGPSSFTSECCKMIEQFFGANFVMLYHDSDDNLAYWLNKVDGVIFAGGVDIHPSVYNHSIWSGSGFSRFDLDRDERELKVLEACKTRRLPYLGICRGHQLIGMSEGMTLIPDLSGSAVCHQAGKQGITLEQHEPLHTVEVPDEMQEKFFNVFGSDPAPERKAISKLMGWDARLPLFVNSYHHQGILFGGKKGTPAGVEVYGISRIDLSKNLKYIAELMGGEQWVSCQWHPEYDWKVNSASRLVLNRFKNMLAEGKKKR